MGRPRIHSMRSAVTAIVAAAAIILTVTGQAGAMQPWQKAWGDYDSHYQWHDAGWWLKNRHHWVTVHHPEWTESYADTVGRIGDSDRLHVWHYGDGGFDHDPNGRTTGEITNELPRARVASSSADAFPNSN